MLQTFTARDAITNMAQVLMSRYEYLESAEMRQNQPIEAGK